MSEHRRAFYTVEESEVGNLYYFAPLTHAAGPFKEQRRVEAIIDVDADGCLAGVELIDRMPAPPKSPTDATADRVKQLEEALRRSMTALNDWQNSYASDMCDPDSVRDTDQRLNEYGVLTYIANVQHQNRLALLNGGSNERA